MRFRSIIYLTIASTLLGCAKQELMHNPVEREHTPNSEITFCNYVAGMTGETKASHGVNRSFTPGEAMGVWGYQTTGDHTDTIFNNQRVENVSDDIWVYEGIKLWNIGSTYKFYGIFPYSPDLYMIDRENKITITNFTNPADPEQQTDLMVSEMRAISPFNMVDMIFHHVMSNVNINARLASGFDTTGVSCIKVYSLKLNNVKNCGDYAQTSWGKGTLPVSEWTNQRGLMEIKPIRDIEIDFTLPYTILMNDFIMMPQQLTWSDNELDNVTMDVVWGLEYYDGSNLKFVKSGIPMGGIKGKDSKGFDKDINSWDAEFRYNYTIVFNPLQHEDSRIEFTASVSNWNQTVEGEIKQPVY